MPSSVTGPWDLAPLVRNGLRHGILSKKGVLAGESQEEFDALLASYTEEHQPEPPTERTLVENMVVAPALLTAAHKLHDLDLRAVIQCGRRPQVALDDRAVVLDRHAFRLDAERPDNVQQRRFRGECAPFAVECNLIFR